MYEIKQNILCTSLLISFYIFRVNMYVAGTN